MTTIGIPVYNCDKELITRCINSILNQSEEDIEILIVNDCCTDSTMQYVDDAISSNPHKRNNIRIVHHKKNTGIAGSRNTILDEARGEYVFFIDCDDYLPSDAIEKLVKKAIEDQAEVVWGSVMEILYETGEERVNIQYPNLSLIGEDELGYYAHHNSKENIRNFVWNVLMSTYFIKQNNLRFESYSYFDDYVFIHKMQPLVKRASLISDFTYYWVFRKGSQSHPTELAIPNYHIKQAIVANIALKQLCKSLNDKSYYEGYCLKLHKNGFFTAYPMVKHRKRIDYHFTNKDIKSALTPIVNLKEIMNFHIYKKENLFFFFLGKTPAFILPLFLKILDIFRLYNKKYL